MKFFKFFKEKMEFEKSGETLNKKTKIIAAIFVFFALIFVGWRYFSKQNDLDLNLQSVSQNEFGEMLDRKLSLTREKIAQYIDGKLQEIDKKLSLTQEKVAQYIDEKLQGVDKEVTSLKQERKKQKNVDGVIRKEVKNQMLSLQEDRIKQMVKQQYREKRKKLIKKMLEDENDL